MLSRNPQDSSQSDLESRAAHLFYKQVNAIVPIVEKLTKKHFLVFHDAYDDARKVLSDLKKILNSYHKKLIDEENNRKQYAIPLYLNKANKIANENLDAARRAYADMVTDDELKKKRLMLEREFLRNNLELEEKRLSVLENDGGREALNRYAELQIEQSDLVRQQKEVERKIDKKCCGSFPWRVRKEGDALKEIETKLRGVCSEMTILSKRSSEIEAVRKQLKTAEADLAELEQKILNQMVEGPRLVNEAAEVVREAEIKYAETEIDIEKDRARHYAAVSAALMDDIQHIYKLFLDLKKSLDLQHPDGNMSFTKDRLDELMLQITSPDKDNKSANIVYLESRGDAIEITGDANIISIR